MMRALLLRLAPVLTCLALAACGGGGSSGGAAQPPDSASLRVQPTSSSLGVNSLTDVVVTLERRGTGVPDGTTVTLSVDQPNLGQVGAASGENQSFNNSATATTSGGQARFRFKSTTATGTATVRASANDGNSGQNVVSTANITLNGGPSNDTRLTLSADRTIIPINSQGVPPSCRSYPYQAEVTVTWRNLRGELVTAPEEEDAMRAAWTSPASVGAITTPDNPETEDVNECELFMASMGVPMNAGRGTIFVRSMQEQGTGTLTVSVVDPDTGENLSAQMEFQISSGVPNLPGTVTVVAEGAASYVNTDRPIRIQVTDGAGSPVPNPQSGGTAWNNVRLEILGAEGERLRTTAADGSTQTGTSVVTRTANGIASAIFIAATRQDTIVLRATADRADNNVDNGITDPVIGEVSIVVSDGQLFSVTLTTPSESLFVNRPGIVVPGDDAPLPPPDGTYSMTVSAIATDRGGNPVLPGTVLQFGLIDSPTSGFPAQGGGTFAIFGLNGDPQEGGTLFTSPTGAFTGAGGGAGPGDTLVLFGKDVTGNRDHESARSVASINSPNSLTVTRPFNHNDDTGQSVDYGAVIPYAIGRASIANIGASAATNENGVATTRFNYPVSQLGRNVIIWAQGNADQVSGDRDTAADVEFYSFAGVGPGILTAAPSSITANQTAQVTVCLTDALNEPIQGVSIGFAFEGLTTGTGTADGDSGTGVVGPTDTSGCTSVRVATAGVEAGEGAESPQLRFFASGAEAVVEIVGGIEPEPEPDPEDAVTLTINIEGEGDVRVSSSSSGFSPPRPGGSALCTHEEAPCTISFVEGTLVGLTALPDTGFDFDAWSGDCTGNAFNSTVTMSADRTCTARFVAE